MDNSEESETREIAPDPPTQDASARASAEPAPTAAPVPAARRHRTETIRAWADAVLAVSKSLLLLALATLAVVSVVIVVSRDFREGRIAVDLDPNAEKLLLDLGSDLDLPSMVVDEVNLKVKGVREFVKLSDLPFIDTGDSAPLSFKLAGMDVSTTEISGMLQKILGSPPSFRVRLGFVCSEGPCDSVKNERIVTLVVDLKAPTKSQRTSFSILTRGLGLRHGLRNAMEHTAENILALAHPQLASVLFLNEGGQSLYRDEAVRLEKLAISSVFVDRDEPSGRDCLRDNVHGVSLGFRGDLDEGLRVLSAATRARATDTSCLVLSQTNAAVIRESRVCMEQLPNARTVHEQFRMARQELEKLDGGWVRLWMSAAERYRSDAFRLGADLSELRYDLLDEEGRAGDFCTGAQSAALPTKVLSYKAIRALVDRTAAELPPGKEHVYFRQTIAGLVDTIERVVPRDDTSNRIELSNVIIQLIDRYLERDGTPRGLFVAKARLLLDVAIAERDTNRDQGQWSAHWSSAVVALQNASATSTIAPLLEPSSDLDPLILLGDTFYVVGDRESAEQAYADAVARFVEQDLPLRDVRNLAIAAARWATGLVHAGTCTSGPERTKWDDVWQRLGASSDDALCADSADQVTTDRVPRHGLLGAIYPLIVESVRACRGLDDNYEMIGCLRRTEPEAFESWLERLGPTPAEFLEEQIRENDDQPTRQPSARNPAAATQ